jgi:ubiquinone/menaquinone biosynthesis C-methylase UbiE
MRRQLVDQQQLTVKQFGARAASYLNSAVHSKGDDLDRLTDLVSKTKPACVLDLGCGAGHASFAAAAGGAKRVIAYDPSADMLAVVAAEGARRGFTNLETRVGAAEVLPFESGTFDLIVTRYSAHHWANVPKALAECARVAVPGARLVVIDLVSPETPLLETCLQVVEFLRDASHVRNYRVSEWRAMQEAAGFRPPTITSWKLTLEFQSWIERIGTPPERVAALHAVFAALPSEVKQYFQVAPDLSFVTDRAWFETTRAA